jgi:hypothetical protein
MTLSLALFALYAAHITKASAHNYKTQLQHCPAETHLTTWEDGSGGCYPDWNKDEDVDPVKTFPEGTFPWNPPQR